VWVLTKETLAHFDGSSWSQNRVPEAIGEIPSWRALLAVAPDGGVWVAGMRGVARYDSDGEWHTFTAAEGLPATPDGELRNVVVAGDQVVVVTTVGAHRFDSTQFVPLWDDPAFVERFTGPLVAVSSDEVWARAESGVWSRYRDGEWEAVGPQNAARAMGYGSGVVASDGAVWLLTNVGLVRVDGDDWTVMSEDATSWQQPAAGADGSVWAIEESDDVATVVRFHADGTRTTIDDPPIAPERLAIGPDGALWAAGGADLARWNGTWQEVPPPPDWSPYWVSGLEVTPDGALWVSGIAPDVFARYADGEWTAFEHDAWQLGQQLVALPDGTVCITPPLTCFDATGTIAGTIAETLPGVYFDDIDIAPDGAVWVHGEQIARLPDGALP
jgi:ligand-binding sensor domain-containing protein